MTHATQANNPSPPTQPPGERLLALDAFRGLTILAMILVNNPGDWQHLYPPLAHAAWHGWTPTDLIFPFFLFIVGTAMAYSLRKYRTGTEVNRRVYLRIVRRTVVLFGLGLLLNASGGLFQTVGSWYTGDGGGGLQWQTLRIPGVLQRIALVYFAASLLVLHLRLAGQVAIAGGLLLGYWALLAWLPPGLSYAERLSPTGNVVRQVDLAVLGAGHMYTRSTSEPTDPEGLLSTLPAIVTTLLGYWAGWFLQSGAIAARRIAALLAAGLVCVAIGLAWDLVLPINKKLWTSSYVMLSGGLAAVGLAGCLAAFDLHRWRLAARPLEIVGINAIFVFVASGLVGRLLVELPVGEQTAKQWIYDHLFAAHLAPEELASLAYAVVTVAAWWLVLWLMARCGWTIRV